MKFSSESRAGTELGNFRLSGTLTDMVNQTVEYQGSSIATGLAKADTQTQSLDTINQRMDQKYGVDVNAEVSRLMELQNAYAANARVVTVVQQLLDTLMKAV
jgi:flagellar hook-associated protein 1 FlgK